MNFTLEDIVRAVEGTAFLTDADSADKSIKVSCAELDSRLVKEGGVFLAQKGERLTDIPLSARFGIWALSL